MSIEQTTFTLADQALLNIVEQIKDDQWDIPTEGIRQMAGKPIPSLRELINYHAYDDIWVPDTLSGMTIDEVGDKYAGDLLGTEPKTSFNSIVDGAVSAVQALEPDDLDRTVHLTYGDFPVREYLKHITCFRGFRAYAIAKFIGVNSTLDPKLVQGMWDEFQPEVEQWRAMGVFGPAIPVADDADLQTKLLGLTGFLQKD